MHEFRDESRQREDMDPVGWALGTAWASKGQAGHRLRRPDLVKERRPAANSQTLFQNWAHPYWPCWRAEHFPWPYWLCLRTERPSTAHSRAACGLPRGTCGSDPSLRRTVDGDAFVFPRTKNEGGRAMLRDWRQPGQRAPSPALCATMVWTLAYPESETKPTHKESFFSPCLPAVLGVETQMVGRNAGGRGGKPVLCCCYFSATGGSLCCRHLARHLYVMKTVC